MDGQGRGYTNDPVAARVRLGGWIAIGAHYLLDLVWRSSRVRPYTRGMKTIHWFGSALFALIPVVGSYGEEPLDFEKDVKPLLESRCVNCHHSGALFGNLNLENREHAFAERPTGPVIIPKQPNESPLYYVLKLPPKDSKAMPPTGHRITDKEMEIIYQWIDEGAKWPEGKAGVLRPVLKDQP